MRFRFSASLLAFAGAAFVTVGAQQPTPPDQGSPTPTQGTSLFDGKTLTGWRAYKKADATGTRWMVENGELTLAPKNVKSGSGDIITNDTFDLFDLSWEWK